MLILNYLFNLVFMFIHGYLCLETQVKKMGKQEMWKVTI